MQDINQQPIKVVILMTDLEDLGVQRVVINLINHFDQSKIEPTLILWKKEGKVATFLKNRAKVIETDHGLLKPRFFFRLIKYFLIIRTIRPDIVLSCVPVTNVSYAIIKWLLPNRISFVACEHAFISAAFSAGEYKGAFKLLYRILFRPTYNFFADRLIMVAYAAKKDAVDNWGVYEHNISVIYNPQDIDELQQRAEEPIQDDWFTVANEPILIAAGRLTKQKGFESLIKAFAILNSKTKCRLVILGRGDLEQALKNLVEELGLTAHVRFLGFQKNPLKYIKHSSVFVLSSIWEAMPMILAEAMAVGIPVVSFDCPSGPREMLDGGNCGYLVEDQNIDALASTLFQVLKNPHEAKKKARRALEKVEQFRVIKIVDIYQKLLAEIVEKKSIN